jgi:glyoxylase-like metal-dependent hydrolase (beta-lactamase superfamily II)
VAPSLSIPSRPSSALPWSARLAPKAPDIAACVNTHHHFDHAGGNHAITAASIPLTAHARACERLANPGQAMAAQLESKVKALSESTLPGAAAVAADAAAFRDSLAGIKGHSWKPTQCLSGDGSVSAGDRTAELRWFGGGHTDNDLAVHCRSVNVLATGDLVFHRMHAYYDASAAANTTRWQVSLRELLKLCDAKTVVVPGHGAVSDASCVRAQIEYFDRMRELVASAIAQGRTRDEVVKLDPPEVYKGVRAPSGSRLPPGRHLRRTLPRQTRRPASRVKARGGLSRPLHPTRTRKP